MNSFPLTQPHTKISGAEQAAGKKRRNNANVLQPIIRSTDLTIVTPHSFIDLLRNFPLADNTAGNLRSDFNFNFNSPHQGPKLYILLIFDSPGPNVMRYDCAERSFAAGQRFSVNALQHSNAACRANFCSLDIFRHVSLLVYE